MKEKLDLALEAFANNEKIAAGERDLREAVHSLEELRYILSKAQTDYPDEYEDAITCLISIS